MPVYRASTIVFPDIETYGSRPADDYKTPRYGIHGTPSNWALEEAVAKLEGGHNAVAVCSGLAAINAALCAFVKSGSHVLIADSVYGPTRNFCNKRLAAFGVEIEYYDPLIGAEIKNSIKTNTCLVFCEAPGSLSFEMQDIPAIAHEAHTRDIPVLADTTWGTPYFFKSFEHGVDISIHAATKYIVGHSDVMMGMIVTNEKYWLPVRRTVADYGYCSSADDCYLALRGLRTIGVRMKQQMQNAIAVARWLEARAEVKRVLFPALESDPRARHLETRFRRRGVPVFARTQSRGQETGGCLCECAEAVWHRLKLGRFRVAGYCTEHCAFAHRHEMAQRRPCDTPAYRA